MALGHPTVDDYIASSPEVARPILEQLREMIHAAVPEAPESIRYGMPAVALGDGYRLYFAAWKKHVGLYPIATLDPGLEAELEPYRTGKDTVRFLLNRPIPFALVERLINTVATLHSAPEPPT